MAVSTAPRTSSAIMFGIWLATVNELAMAGPRTIRIINCLANPVIRLVSVAIAMEPVAARSREFVSLRSPTWTWASVSNSSDVVVARSANSISASRYRG